jgi:hypothetical protein
VWTDCGYRIWNFFFLPLLYLLRRRSRVDQTWPDSIDTFRPLYRFLVKQRKARASLAHPPRPPQGTARRSATPHPICFCLRASLGGLGTSYAQRQNTGHAWRRASSSSARFFVFSREIGRPRSSPGSVHARGHAAQLDARPSPLSLGLAPLPWLSS